jgi:hypothetical protein
MSFLGPVFRASGGKSHELLIVSDRVRAERRSVVGAVKGDRVEAMVDTSQGVETFEIVATRAGRRIEVVTSRGVVEVREVTRTGQPVRTGPFMTSRLIALVEHL